MFKKGNKEYLKRLCELPYKGKPTNNEVTAMLLEVLDNFTKVQDQSRGYSRFYREFGLTSSFLQYRRKKSTSIDRVMTMLYDMWHDSLVDAASSGEGNYNGCRFILQSKHGLLTKLEQHQIDNETKELNLQEQVITIGFKEEDAKDESIN